MKTVETDWWFISLPEEWEAEQEEESILITDPDELGCISLTCLQAESDTASEADARRMMEDFNVDPSTAETVELNGIPGLYVEGEEEGDFLREWYLFADDMILLVSYSCSMEDKDMDRGIIDEILDTLELNVDEES